jgi:hypothetical protein
MKSFFYHSIKLYLITLPKIANISGAFGLYASIEYFPKTEKLNKPIPAFGYYLSSIVISMVAGATYPISIPVFLYWYNKEIKNIETTKKLEQ